MSRPLARLRPRRYFRLRIIKILRKWKTPLSARDSRRLRHYLGLTQEDLARRMGITRLTVARWEGLTIISPQNEYILRLIVISTMPVSTWPKIPLSHVRQVGA